MSNTKISVIIPVYNAKNYIEKTLNSVLNQSIDGLEIIVINDGSTDGSKDILDYYDNTYGNIKVIHQKNKGVSAARNLGILSSTGEYIGFVDSDDLLDKKMYESMYKKAISYNADICICGFVEEDLNKNILRKYVYKQYDQVITKENIPTMFKKSLDENLEPLGGAPIWNKIFKRSLLIENNILIDENITVGEDFCLNIHCFNKANTVVGVSEYFYHYMNVNPDSIMSNVNLDKLYKFINGRKSILDNLSKYNFYSDKYFQFENGRNFANLIQIASHKIDESNPFKDAYTLVLEILTSTDFKYSINNSNDDYLSKNMKLIKNLSKLNLNICIFMILYMRCKSSR